MPKVETQQPAKPGRFDPRDGTAVPKRTNQHLPCPPDDQLRACVEYYWYLGCSAKDIASNSLDHFPKGEYSLSPWTVRRRCDVWGLKSTRKQDQTVESIAQYAEKIKERFPDMGAATLRDKLRIEKGIKVPQSVVLDYLHITEPVAVAQRRYRTATRRQFKGAGVNEIIAMDQHDKLKGKGLRLHVGLDPVSGYIHWLKVWWTNSNPNYIAKQWLDNRREHECITLFTQSDPGVENWNVAYAQSALRHYLDAYLDPTTSQHRYYRLHGNIKPEIHWSLLRRTWMREFEALLDWGMNHGWYVLDDALQCLTFRYVFIPWMQAELDEWVRLRNRTTRRADKKKLLPHGIPELIMAKPERYGQKDFRVPVSPELFDQIEEKYCPPDDPVFDLVPKAFLKHAHAAWVEIGQPVVAFENAWDVYKAILEKLENRRYDAEFESELAQTASDMQEPGVPEDAPATDPHLHEYESQEAELQTINLDDLYVDVPEEDLEHHDDEDEDGAHAIGLDHFYF